MYIDRVYNADEAMLLQANLLLHGCSMDQVQFFTASRQAALARRSRLHAWDTAMPPMIRQTFGMRNSRRQGVRIPVPANYYSEVPCLPALRPTTDFHTSCIYLVAGLFSSRAGRSYYLLSGRASISVGRGHRVHVRHDSASFFRRGA